MANIFYFLEFVILSVVLIPLSLNYDGSGAITIPSFSQVKSSVSVTPEEPNSLTDYDQTETVVCGNTQNQPVGFPFVHTSNDTCDYGTSYKVGLFLNYVTVLLVALAITKLTSLLADRIIRSK